ncbi:MAG TPA: hypothetical protein VFB93_14440 [Burkholderiales bacterium]|nr:hypothetical protein [Burkholderiales bacterium]
MITRIATGFLAAAAALGVNAADIRPILKGGLDTGGDTLVSVTFVGGESDKIKANEGFYLGGGMAIIDEPRSMEYHLTVAYKIGMVSADNGDIDWTRVPLEALAFYRFAKVRIGGGLTYHLNPELEGSGVASSVNVKFKNALGFLVQADWRITQGLALGLRYTFIEYEAKSPASGTAKGDGAGLTISYTF